MARRRPQRPVLRQATVPWPQSKPFSSAESRHENTLNQFSANRSKCQVHRRASSPLRKTGFSRGKDGNPAGNVIGEVCQAPCGHCCGTRSKWAFGQNAWTFFCRALGRANAPADDLDFRPGNFARRVTVRRWSYRAWIMALRGIRGAEAIISLQINTFPTSLVGVGTCFGRGRVIFNLRTWRGNKSLSSTFWNGNYSCWPRKIRQLCKVLRITEHTSTITSLF